MDTKNPDIKYLVALSHFPKFGPTRLARLKKYFPDYNRTFNATANELGRAGLEENIVSEFLATRPAIDPDELSARLESEQITVIDRAHSAYPKLLSEIYDPPEILYAKGEFSDNDEFSVAIVGSRKFTAYGRQAAENITHELATNGITIVSGLALGIDAIAHGAALAAGGRTIAVLGNGIDTNSLYPAANRYLAEKIIAAGGLILSEFPLGMAPLRHNFPQRNRIISGLSRGTLVVEAGEKSGSLITARHALDQNREVFAVPGNIYSQSSLGPNLLIKQGAKAVTAAVDILEALDLSLATAYIDTKKILPETDEEKRIIASLSHEPIHVNELVRLTKLDTSLINSTLVMMEMKGMVRNLGNMEYVLAR